jgi:uncharacterized protein YbdZ (MbtH family)
MSQKTPLTHRDVIDLWEETKEMAEVIGASWGQVRQWRSRGRIPSTWYVMVAREAQREGHGWVTAEWLDAAARTPEGALA